MFQPFQDLVSVTVTFSTSCTIDRAHMFVPANSYQLNTTGEKLPPTPYHAESARIVYNAMSTDGGVLCNALGADYEC